MKVLEQCQKPSVGGVFLVIVIQTYDSLKDLLLHHKHPQFTHSCLLQQFSKREVTLGDLKSAFMQSDKDVSERSQGQLYASLPPGGIPLADGTWVEEGSFIQLNAAVYGLVNAPSAWRKTIVRGIENLGYRRSCYDPCIFCLMDESGPQGHILIEVDDLATHGNAVHAENMAKLQKTFKFGKWKTIYNSEGDYAGRTVIQDQSYGFHIHQAKFVQERLSPIVIPRGRRSDKKSETTDGEKRQLRAVWGSINWVQRESCPDVSALASLGMGSLNHSTVQDLCDANDSHSPCALGNCSRCILGKCC